MNRKWTILLFFIFISLVRSNASVYKQLNIDKTIIDENDIIKIIEPTHDIYFFKNHVFLLKVSESEEIKMSKLSSGEPIYALSISKNLSEQITFKNEDKAEWQSLLEDREKIILRDVKEENNNLVFFVIGFILLISFIRVFYPEYFYSYLTPFISYSSTVENTSVINLRNLILPVMFLIFSITLSVQLITQEFSYQFFFTYLLLTFLFIVFKGAMILFVNQIFDTQKRGAKHFIEFLKVTSLSSIVIIFLLIFVHVNEIKWPVLPTSIVLLYVFIWLIRVFYVFYRKKKVNILYFFSYLCATELIPSSVVLFLWV